MIRNIKKYFCVLPGLICCISMSVLASEAPASYADPEELASDFLESYFNVSLEGAREQLAGIEQDIEDAAPTQELPAQEDVAEVQVDSGEITMQDFFIDDGIDCVLQNSYQLMMMEAAVTYDSDIVPEEIVLEETSTPGRYSFEAVLQYFVKANQRSEREKPATKGTKETDITEETDIIEETNATEESDIAKDTDITEDSKEETKETESSEPPRQISGYIDMVETDSGWMIDAFNIRSHTGSF